MKLTKVVKPGLSIEVDGDNNKDLFENLASLEEVFGEQSCGKCKKGNFRHIVRVVDDNKFYEIVCLSCGAKLSYGSHKKGGTLFPKRKDNEEGSVTGEGNKYLPDKGWLKWDGKKLV